MSEKTTGQRLLVTGSGYCLLENSEKPALFSQFQLSPVDYDEFSEIEQWLLEKGLRVPKNRKFMGVQDMIAVVAAARALHSAGHIAELHDVEEGFEISSRLQQRCGIYMAVGYIPFEYPEIEELCSNSQEHGRFSMQRFSNQGLAEVNPLLTFRCLPNMPSFHVSMNFSIRGPYFVTYPDIGQLYVAMEQAIQALCLGLVDIALIGGVAYQNNFLAKHQLRKLRVNALPLDCAAFMVLERESAPSVAERAKWELLGMSNDYYPHNLLDGVREAEEHLTVNDQTDQLRPYVGPGSLPLLLSLLSKHGDFDGEVKHRVLTASNVSAISYWQSV